MLCLARAAVAAEDAAPITAEAEIAGLLRDHTIYGVYLGDGDPWIEYYAVDGRSAFAVNGCVYRGKWWVAAGRACFAYPELEGGRPSCFTVARRGEALEFSMEAYGGLLPTARTERIAEGNPEHLQLDVGACLGM